MEAVWDRCCGLDIGKRFLLACVMVGSGREVEKEIRRFDCTTQALLDLRDWLREKNCQAVAMESTGPYWKPIWNVLEDEGLALVLTNPKHMKAVPGRKSDVRDSEWICDLLRHGLLKASYVPSRAQRELRELERYRRSLVEERTREVNRLQKVLEGANIKLGMAVTNVVGKSGTKILQALADGTEDPEQLADLVTARIKASRAELEQALTGYVQPHQRYMLGHQLDHIAYLNGQIEDVDREIAKRLEPAEKVLQRLQTIPGVGRRTAEVIVAEVGTDVLHFPSAAHLASWSGLAPGQNESAGKQKTSRARHGNATLRSVMVEAARAASRTKGTYLQAQHAHLSRRLKGKKATVAVAHSMIVMVYHILKGTDTAYQDLGSDYFFRHDREAIQRRAVRQLEQLGLHVTIEPITAA